MKKKITILILLAVLIGIVLPIYLNTALAQLTGALVGGINGACPAGTAEAGSTEAPGVVCRVINPEAYRSAIQAAGAKPNIIQENQCGWTNISACLPAAVKTGVSAVAELLLVIGALILTLCGNIFNFILTFTIVNFAEKINDARGLGGAINNAWATLRDVGNIVFIFILLWAAIRLILGLGDEMGKTIRNIIIVGLLINFSLFFSKVVIDASNIAAVGFYNSIMSGAGRGEVVKVAGLDFDANDFAGIFMRYTKIQSFFDPAILVGADGDTWGKGPLIVGIMGFITMLVLAMVLLIAGVMFLARFLLLIFLMILSPVALVGYALPALNSKFHEWWNQLLNQSFFAPFFMLLIWVAIKIMAGVSSSLNITGSQKFAAIQASPLDAVGLILNFAIVIGLIIMALILSKQMAIKTKGFGAITGAVGTAGFGGVALASRQTIGRAGRAITQSSSLRDAAAKGGAKGWFARQTLKAGGKTGESSLDLRNLGTTRVGRALGGAEVFKGMGKAGGKGGYEKFRSERIKSEEEFGKKFLGQTPQEKVRAESEKSEYEAKKKTEDERIKTEREAIQNRIKTVQDQRNETLSAQKQKDYDEEITRLQEQAGKIEYSDEFKKFESEHQSARDAGKVRQRARASELEKDKPSNVFDIFRTRKERALKLRDVAAGKAKKDKKKALKDLAEAAEIDIGGEEEGEGEEGEEKPKGDKKEGEEKKEE